MNLSIRVLGLDLFSLSVSTEDARSVEIIDLDSVRAANRDPDECALGFQPPSTDYEPDDGDENGRARRLPQAEPPRAGFWARGA